MRPIVVAISGATGVPIAVRVLDELQRHPEYEVHLIISRGAELTIPLETDLTVDEVRAMAAVCHDLDDVGACVASGSFSCEGMIVVPCSMKTLAGIASGYSDNLILRAADVTLKEGQKLVLAARETPLSYIHLRNMLEAKKAGAVIIPPMVAYYNRPESIQDITDHIAGKTLDQFGIECTNYKRWTGESK